MKKSSHLRKVMTILLIIDSYMLPFDCNDVKAADHKILNVQNIYEPNNISEDFYLAYDSSIKASNESDNRKDDVVRCAYNLIGKPYVYGAAGPNEFDCSGLTQYVYKTTGENLSRTTYTQVKEGVEVSRNDLAPGDLVFFNTNGYMSHVGIYVGNGSFIHAPRTGKPVMVSSLNEGYYCERFAAARRIFN